MPNAMRAAGAVLPIAILVLAVYAFQSGFLLQVPGSPVPVERVDIERIVLRPGEITAYMVNSGAEDVKVAQLLVDDIIWGGTISPSDVIPRLGKATLSISYPWVEGEPLLLTIVTSNSFKFEHELEVALPTPEFGTDLFVLFALMGSYIGLLPVFLGVLWYPVLRSLKPTLYAFLLSFTVGLLILLGADSIFEAFEISAGAPAIFNATPLVIIGLLATFMSLMVASESSLSTKGVASRGLSLAYLIALGIGLHNLGEGLAVGAAYAVGAVALGAFLIIGFTIHNFTEGIAIVAPLSSSRTAIRHLVAVAFIAGAPTIAGALIGGFSFSSFWASLFLAVGAGAIFQVVFVILRYMAESRGFASLLGDLKVVSGITLGMLVIYLTGFLVAA
ncbi:MAG: metal transporter [Thaumarchaeota archaeon]|nr:metal transporter [Nitrososphaerota archaeon]